MSLKKMLFSLNSFSEKSILCLVDIIDYLTKVTEPILSKG